MPATLDSLPPELILNVLGYLPIVDYFNLKLTGSHYIAGLVRQASSRLSRAEYCAALSQGDAQRRRLPKGRLRNSLCITIERNQLALVNFYLRKYQRVAQKQWKGLPGEDLPPGTENQVFRAALHWAAYYGSERVARLLLDSDLVDVNVRCSSRRVVSPLHVAAMYGHAGMVDLLISYGAEIDAFDRQGRTAVELALEAGHNDVATLLQSKGAAANMEDVLRKHGDDWFKLTQGACKPYAYHPPLRRGLQPRLSTIGRLLTYFLVYNCVVRDTVTWRGLEGLQKKLMYLAILYDLRDRVVSLLDGEYIFHTAMRLGWCRKKRCGASALHLATSMGNNAITKILLDHGALPTVECQSCLSGNSTAATAVHWAIRRDNEQAIRLFMNSGSPINIKSETGQTYLHIAALLGKSKIVDLLLQHGAPVDELTSYGETPLHLAFRDGNDVDDGEVCKIVRSLLDRGANVNARTKFNQTPLHAAVAAGNIGAVRQLLAHGADVSAVYYYGWTPLHLAASKDIVEALLEAGADVNARDKDGNTRLHLLFSKHNRAVQPSDSAECFDLLMRCGADINARNESGSSTLHHALSVKSPLVNKILSCGADPNAIEGRGPPPLGLAAHLGQDTAFEELLNRGADVHWKDAKGQTLLHYASSDFYRFQTLKPFTQLLERGVKPDIPDENGHTPLFLAVKKEKSAFVTCLLKAGADANARDKAGLTPLQHFTPKSYRPAADIVSGLVSHGADINEKDSSGDTLLHRAIRWIDGQHAITAFVENGAEPNVRDANGHTPLQLAIWKGCDEEIIRALLKGGADPNVRQGDKQLTLLHYIVSRPDMWDGYRLQLLVEYGGRADAEDINKCTPMDIARETGSTHYQRILERGPK